MEHNKHFKMQFKLLTFYCMMQNSILIVYKNLIALHYISVTRVVQVVSFCTLDYCFESS